MGLVHIYCGDGKGKTTASIGLAVRAAGCGCDVVIARFLKNDDSGEVRALQEIKGIQVLPCERSFGFTWQMTEEEKSEAACYYAKLLERAILKGCEVTEAGGRNAPSLLVLDEICAAINSGLVEEKQVLDFLDTRPDGLEVVMTGREPSEGLMSRAGYISEIKKIKHPFDAGVPARQGIEY